MDEVMYHSSTNPKFCELNYQLCLPQALKEKVLVGLHDKMGHQGVEMTEDLVRGAIGPDYRRMSDNGCPAVRAAP